MDGRFTRAGREYRATSASCDTEPRELAQQRFGHGLTVLAQPVALQKSASTPIRALSRCN
jgi:hypothetical protein